MMTDSSAEKHSAGFPVGVPDGVSCKRGLKLQDHLNIKKEEEEPWESLEEKQEMNFTAVNVKSEEDEAQCSLPHWRKSEENIKKEAASCSSAKVMKVEPNGNISEGPEATRQQDTDGEETDCSDTDDSQDWMEPLSQSEGQRTNVTVTADALKNVVKDAPRTLRRIKKRFPQINFICGSRENIEKSPTKHCFVSPSTMEDPSQIAALYYLWKMKNRRQKVRRRRRTPVNKVYQRCIQRGEFHSLLQELRLDDGRFQQYLRVTSAQFENLLCRIGPKIYRQDTNYRLSISAAERLSICLRYLATGDSFRSIANSFRVGVSTVSVIVPEVSTAIWDCLVEEFLAVPTTEEWKSIADTFEARWNFPLCCGALDGKHVVLKALSKIGSKYSNYMGSNSLVLLAVVDARYCFRVIDVGAYGRTSEGGILANSTFGKEIRAGTVQLPADQTLPGADHLEPQPHVFVTDDAFPLRKNIMRPFPEGDLTKERRIFNYRLSRVRMVVENAFGMLSSQWRMYSRPIEVKVDVAEKCVKATCALHNFLRQTSTAVTANNPTDEFKPLPGLESFPANNTSGREAIKVREAFTSYFSAEGAVPWQDSRIT